MPDRAKVTKALECCDDKGSPNCEQCPYMDDDFVGTCASRNPLFRDALALLKGHIMTPEEVEAVGQGDWVWIEIRHTGALYPAIRWDNDFVGGNDDYFMLCEVTECDDYLRDYRFWSAQPTREQTRMEKWHER